jgi:cytochrome bd-type quinol oxidase subunit 2
MNKITKNILSLALIMTVFGLPMLVGAQWSEPDPSGTGLPATEAETLLTNILNTILRLVAILAVLGFVISGVLYITAGGNSDRVDQAQNWLKYSIIGVVVALIGYIVVNFISGVLTQ